MAMIYDLFVFNGEYDLLEIRFNILSPYVDKFIICEMMETFSGRPKPLYWVERDKDRFAEWEDKVIYVVPQYGTDGTIMEMMAERPYVDQEPFRKAFYQKESLRRPLDFENVSDDSLIIYGDADEIINPAILSKKVDKPHKLRQLAYSYWLNNRSQEDWRGTVVAHYKDIKDGSLNDLRAYPIEADIWENGGWHFTNIGGIEAVKKKIESYDHQEVNIPWVTEGLEERMVLNVDFLGRGYRMWPDESQLPDYILQNKEKYKKLWKLSPEIR